MDTVYRPDKIRENNVHRSFLDVQSFYRTVDQIPRNDVLAMIQLYPDWHKASLDSTAVGKLHWFVHPSDSDHISQVLTNHGNDTSIASVARAYEQIYQESLSQTGTAQKIESMIQTLKAGIPFTPVIIVPGDKYPDSPGSDFIDGIHRALAFYLYKMRNPESSISAVDAYIGKKAPLWERAMSKITQKLRRK